MSRKAARESVFKLIFEYLFNHEPNKKTYSVFSSADMDDGDVEYMRKVYYGVIAKFGELSETVAEFSRGFELDRIYKPDLAAMLLAAYEIKYMPEVPAPVAINEAVELVKKYSAEKSGTFVNGVLAGIYADASEKK